MSKNLLAVDDSATMRRVLEITFSGEDFNVLSAGDRAGALAKLGEDPSVILIDTTLGAEDGYALCKEVRARSQGAAIVLLSSRYNPYDQAKGRDAGADDYMDKPFDTQQLIDKVRKILIAREGAGLAAPPPVASPRPPAVAPAPSPQPAPVAAMPRPAPPAAPQPPKFQPGPMPQRSGTLMFSVDGPPVPAPGPQNTAETAAPPPPPVMARPAPVAAPEPPAAPRPAPAAAPRPVPAAAPAPAAPAPVAAAAVQVNGQLGPKLADLGLTPDQVEGVLALSREVVEKVVWEVVPQLAEAIIKEEIARLTK